MTSVDRLLAAAPHPSPFNANLIIASRDPVSIAVPVLGRPNVAIIGAGPLRSEAPLSDTNWEVWGLNAVPVVDAEGRFRADRWFEMHQHHAQSADDLRWIRACPVPLYVPDDLLMAETPRAVRYPLAHIEETLGAYWACTFAYQIALAIDTGFERIGLYGVELMFGDERERTVELACVSWWLGFAEGKGIDIALPDRSPLCRHPARYGIEYDEEKALVAKYVEQRRIADQVRADMQLGGLGG